MKQALLRFYVRLQIVRDDSGQDLVEYVLLASLISLAAVAGMKSYATALATAFTDLGTRLGTYTS